MGADTCLAAAGALGGETCPGRAAASACSCVACSARAGSGETNCVVRWSWAFCRAVGPLGGASGLAEAGKV